jgi:hypothetical protein
MADSNAEQAISQEKYVSVATFRKTGVAVATATSSRSTAAGSAS